MAAQRSNRSAMISRRRSAPTARARPIECTTSANSTVTCLYSADCCCVIGDPQASQNRALSRSSIPHAVQVASAVIGPLVSSTPPDAPRIGAYSRPTNRWTRNTRLIHVFGPVGLAAQTSRTEQLLEIAHQRRRWCHPERLVQLEGGDAVPTDEPQVHLRR